MRKLIKAVGVFMLCCCLIVTSAGTIFAEGIIAEIPILQYEQYIEELLNLYSNSKIVYTISDSKQLGSLTIAEGYTFYELSPFGYAIVANSNQTLMEVCYDDCDLPFLTGNDNSLYYYIGPSSFALKEQGSYIDVETNIRLSQHDINYITTVETEIVSFATPSQNNNWNSRAAINNRIIQNVEFDYFSNLSSLGNNVYGTCTVVAIAMLLGYYDVFVNDDCVDDYYMNASSTPEGTTDEFHQLLCDYVYGENALGGIQIYDAAPAINDYLSDQGISVAFVSPRRHNVATTRTSVINLIDQGKPVVASMHSSSGATMTHSVVVYGYIYTVNDGTEPVLPFATTTAIPENAMYRVHKGYIGSSSHYNQLYSSSWFEVYGYIDDTP